LLSNQLVIFAYVFHKQGYAYCRSSYLATEFGLAGSPMQIIQLQLVH